MRPLFASFRVFRAQTSDLLRIIHGNESRFQSRLIRVIRVSKISVALKIFRNFVPNFREQMANDKHYPERETTRKTSMKKQQNNSTRGWALHVALSIALLSISAVLLASSFKATPATSGLSAFKPATQARTLTFGDRVAYQRAIEEVYWQHRIWPKANTGPKPPLAKVMSQAQIEEKVEDYLRNSQALEDYWQRLITPDQLQAEMERMASHTKQPGVLREIFAALGNDPLVIAECLARPV